MQQNAPPLLSIIIPCYNAQDYLERCLQSIIKQPELVAVSQIIAVDDASTDKTKDILLNYAGQNLLQPIFLTRNGGPSIARNAGMEQAIGQYFWFIDSDDYLLPHAGRQLLALMAAKPKQDLYAFGYTSTNSSQELIHKAPFRLAGGQGQFSDTEALLYELFASMRFFPWNKLIRADIARQHPYPPGHWFEDISTIAAIAADCKRVAWIQQSLIHYFMNPHSTTGKMRPQACRDLFWCLKDFVQLYKSKPEWHTPRLQFALASFLLKHCIDAICLLALSKEDQNKNLAAALALAQALPKTLLEDAQKTQKKRIIRLRYKNWRADRLFVQRLPQVQDWSPEGLLKIAKIRYKIRD